MLTYYGQFSEGQYKSTTTEHEQHAHTCVASQLLTDADVSVSIYDKKTWEKIYTLGETGRFTATSHTHMYRKVATFRQRYAHTIEVEKDRQKWR